MSRIARGWELTKKSWRLLRTHRTLIRFPLYGGLAALLPTIALLLPGLYLIDTQDYAPGLPLVALGFFLSVFAVSYFAVGLAAAADAIFHGRDASVSDGLAVASRRVGAIAGWALLSMLIGLVVAALESRPGLAVIAGRIFGAAWSLITFLAVPVIAIEGTGPVETLKRSASLFRSRWPGQVTGNLVIGGVVLLIGILPAVAIVAIGVAIWATAGAGADVAAGAVLVAIGAAIFVVALLIQRALQGVFGVALYRYAIDGDAVAGFSRGELESAVGQRA